jgi:hypothetical protein
MVARVLIIGGYGNFGSYIAASLAPDPQIRLLIGGRAKEKALSFAAQLGAANPAEGHAIDIDGDLDQALARIAPDIVVHTTGPFQRQDYRVARACIARGCHYLDLADARDFVVAIGELDAAARERGVIGNCDIPDLDLFPQRYPGLRGMRFAAGHELKILHIGTWALSWLVRFRLVSSLDIHAERLLRLSFLFDRLGSSRSGFHMFLDGEGRDGRPRHIRFFIVARSGHGPNIPCIPAVLLARRLSRGEIATRGALPCLDLIGLEDYLGALEGLDITVHADPLDA